MAKKRKTTAEMDAAEFVDCMIELHKLQGASLRELKKAVSRVNLKNTKNSKIKNVG